jgi:hypothetical protein
MKIPPKITINVRPIKPSSIGHAGAYQPDGVKTDSIKCWLIKTSLDV